MCVRGEALRGERGASLVEYSLLMALIAVVCLGALQYFGSESGNSISNSTSKIVSSGEAP